MERSGDDVLSRAVAILRVIAAERGLRLPGVVARSGLPKSTCHRLLGSLERVGLVQRSHDGDGNVFILGTLFSDLAAGAANWQRLAQIARPIMERLRDRTNETVLLHVFDGDARVVVEQVESLQQLRRTYTDIGIRVPIYGGAASKIYLASLSETELRRYWSRFPRTITQPDKPGVFKRFADELRRIRRQGYSITYAELTPGVASIAAGVYSPQGRVLCCLSVTGPLSRLNEQMLKRFRPGLADAADELARATSGIAETWGARSKRRRKSVKTTVAPRRHAKEATPSWS